MTMIAPKTKASKVRGKTLYIREPHHGKNPIENEVFHQTMKTERALINSGVEQTTASDLTYGVLCRTSGIEPEEVLSRSPEDTKECCGHFVRAIKEYRTWIEDCTNST